MLVKHLPSALCAVGMLTMSTVASANGVADSVQELINGGGSITVLDKRFDNWAIGDTANFDLDDILVVPLADQPLNPGLRFVAVQDAWTISPGQTLQGSFLFDVSVLDGRFRIKDASIELRGYSVVDPTQQYYLRFYSSSYLIGAVDLMVTDTQPFDSGTFAPVGSLAMEFQLAIGGDTNIVVSEVDVRFSQIPEPTTLALLGLGLAGLAALPRRRQ